jgi:hypothetical protein
LAPPLACLHTPCRALSHVLMPVHPTIACPWCGADMAHSPIDSLIILSLYISSRSPTSQPWPLVTHVFVYTSQAPTLICPSSCHKSVSAFPFTTPTHRAWYPFNPHLPSWTIPPSLGKIFGRRALLDTYYRTRWILFPANNNHCDSPFPSSPRISTPIRLDESRDVINCRNVVRTSTRLCSRLLWLSVLHTWRSIFRLAILEYYVTT